MNADEKAIIDYLKGWPGSYVSGREIAKKVGGRSRYEDDRGWAIPILTALMRSGVVEADHLGYFRLKVEAKKKHHDNKHVSPQMLKILKSSGKSFDGLAVDEDEEPKSAYDRGSSVVKSETPEG